MTIATQDGLISARASKRQSFTFMRASIANQTAGTLCSLYRATGGPPTQPAIPGSAAVPTDALTFTFTNPTGGDTTYLDALGAVGTQPGVFMLYDRLFHIGGLSGTSTSAQAVNSQSTLTLPIRGATVDEVEWWLEWYSDTGSTAVTATVAVTYSDATTGTPTVALGATMRASRLLQIVPAQGKYIASVQSVTLSATTGTAGSFGVTCGNRLGAATIYMPAANIGGEKEAVFTNVADDACLWPVVCCSTTSSGDVRGEFTLIQG